MSFSNYDADIKDIKDIKDKKDKCYLLNHVANFS